MKLNKFRHLNNTHTIYINGIKIPCNICQFIQISSVQHDLEHDRYRVSTDISIINTQNECISINVFGCETMKTRYESMFIFSALPKWEDNVCTLTCYICLKTKAKNITVSLPKCVVCCRRKPNTTVNVSIVTTACIASNSPFTTTSFPLRSTW